MGEERFLLWKLKDKFVNIKCKIIAKKNIGKYTVMLIERNFNDMTHNKIWNSYDIDIIRKSRHGYNWIPVAGSDKIEEARKYYSFFNSTKAIENGLEGDKSYGCLTWVNEEGKPETWQAKNIKEICPCKKREKWYDTKWFWQ